MKFRLDVGEEFMLLDTWPYYYVEIARENLEWKKILVCSLIVLCGIILLLIMNKICQILKSSYGKTKYELVDILAVYNSVRTGEGANKIINSRSKILVREYGKRRGHRHIVVIDAKGINEGDIGFLEHKGQNGISFIKKESLVHKENSIYYKFGFESKNQNLSVKPERKRRKYW